MKLSNNTMNVLKNFSTINENIFVKSGNIIETVSKQKNILAKAEVSETFSDEFGVYDLNKFLSVLTLKSDSTPEIDFENNDIIIKSRGGKTNITYRKAPKDVLVLPPEKKINMDNAEINFTFSNDDLDWCLKAAPALDSPNVAFVSDGENISVQLSDLKNDASHVSETVIGSSSDGKKYKIVFAIENFKFIPGSYTVTIHSRGIAHFKNNNLSIEYWVAAEPNSSYEG